MECECIGENRSSSPRVSKKKRHRPKRPQGADGLGQWVVEAVETNRYKPKFGNPKPILAHYVKAYALAVAKRLMELLQRSPTAEELRKVLGHTQCPNVRKAFHALRDEGYVRLNNNPFEILEILKYPYFVPRPALRCIEHGEPVLDRLESFCTAFEERQNEDHRGSEGAQ